MSGRPRDQATLTTTGRLLNVGEPEEFAKSTEAQRAQDAAFAKELGVPILHYEDVWFIPAILGALALIVVAVDVGTMMRSAK